MGRQFGEIFLAHADALADEVVLVPTQLTFEPTQLAFVSLFLLRRPSQIGRAEVCKAKLARKVAEPNVDADILALLRVRNGERDGLAGEGWAVDGNVGKAEREEGA